MFRTVLLSIVVIFSTTEVSALRMAQPGHDTCGRSCETEPPPVHTVSASNFSTTLQVGDALGIMPQVEFDPNTNSTRRKGTMFWTETGLVGSAQNGTISNGNPPAGLYFVTFASPSTIAFMLVMEKINDGGTIVVGH